MRLPSPPAQEALAAFRLGVLCAAIAGLAIGAGLALIIDPARRELAAALVVAAVWPGALVGFARWVLDAQLERLLRPRRTAPRPDPRVHIRAPSDDEAATILLASIDFDPPCNEHGPAT